MSWILEKENDREAEKNEGQQQGQASPLLCKSEASASGLMQTECFPNVAQNTSQVEAALRACGLALAFGATSSINTEDNLLIRGGGIVIYVRHV